VFIPWAAAGEAAEIGRAHVGIMPLPDTDYTRGKCALKALQYMALGLPTIVSPVGANMEVVEHGRTGLHATTLDEWVDALEKLASSRQLRTAIGRAGRETVEKRFSSVVASDKFAEAVRMGLRRARSLPRQVSG
jgi:glycosyltransferase involved in cell wall biosynthesis